ncbi:TPA: ABC transporter ATP-binding protein [Enterobacter ludwigii]
MLSLRAVNQFYGSQHTLWNVDLDFPKGMCTGVIGLPGMGKTTLMNCIAGKVPVDSGTIIWHEAGAPPRDLLSQTPEPFAGPGIGYVPQDRRIFSQLTIDENLHIAMRATGKPDPEAKSDVYDLFPELYALRQTRANTLSPDDQYQLALANALVIRPRMLILDEPMHGAGHSFAQKLSQLLVRLNRELGMTVLLAEQQLSFIRRVAERFCMLYRGRNVAQGHVNELDDELIAHWMSLEARR